jgi:sugar transferase (PEP-CTERM/EpsH1 system associated)
VGIPARRIHQIYNGVDAVRFQPAAGVRAALPGCPFDAPGHWLIGTVGRMAAVKNQLLLARAFVRARTLDPGFAAVARLVLVGDGPLRAQALAVLQEGGSADAAWLPGERADVPDVMRALDCFVLPSLAEGISNTILEAMASGLPVVATAVGGNAELVDDGRTGRVVPNNDTEAMAAALLALWRDQGRTAAMGAAGRAEVEKRFSLQAMVAAYQNLYTRQLAHAASTPREH